jgi:2-methylisocitrate lyase-like PEP mutase family enzyme
MKLVIVVITKEPHHDRYRRVTDLSSLGVRRLSVGPKLAEAAFTAMRRAWVELFENGTYARLFDADLTFAYLNGLFLDPIRGTPTSS